MAENMLTGGGINTNMYQLPPPVPQTNPLTGIMQATQAAQAATALQQQQFNLGKAKFDFLMNSFGSIAAMENPSFDHVANIAANGVRTGVLTPEDVANTLPQWGGLDSAQIKRKAADQLQLGASYAEKMAAAYGNTRLIDNGNTIVPVKESVRTGGLTPSSGAIPRALSPEGASTPTPVTDANGNTTTMTRSQFAGPTGTGQGGFAGAITRGQPRQTQPARPDASGGGTQQPVAPGVPGPGASFGPGLDALNKDYVAANEGMKSIQPLLRALPLAEKLGTTGTGPGTKAWNDAKAFLVSNGFIKPDANVDIRNELDKYLSQAVAKSPLAGRSDMGTLVSQASNPNTTSQTNAATIELIRNGIAQARMDAASSLAYGDQNPSGYLKHKAGFAQSQDPQAYRLDMMLAEERAALVRKMADLPSTDPKRKQFFESLKAAKTVGVSAGQ